MPARRRGLTAREHRLELQPVHDVERLPDGRWRTIGPEPLLALRPEGASAAPVGDLRLEFPLQADGAAFPTLIADTGMGFPGGLRIPLPVPRAGRIVAIVTVPATTVALGLQPGAGTFQLGSVKARQLSLARAVLAHAAPELRRVIRDPRRLAVLVARAVRLFRYRGVRGVLERLRRATRQHTESADYEQWAERYAELSEPQRSHIRAWVAALSRRPVVSLLLTPGTAPGPELQRTLEALRSQLYSEWEACIPGGGSSAELAGWLVRFSGDSRIRLEPRDFVLRGARGELVALLAPGDVLAEHALSAVVEAFEARADLAVVYVDEDCVDGTGRRSPHFKPNWSPELLRSTNYVGRAVFFRTDRVRKLGGWLEGPGDVPQHGLLLRYTAGVPPGAVQHIPAVLVHRGAEPALVPAATDAGMRAVQASLDAATTRGQVEPGLRPATYHVRYALPPRPPLVTVIIPTRDRQSLLETCIRSLDVATAYRPLEVLVVDNDSRDRRAREYLRTLEVGAAARILRYPHPFNYSAMNNLAVREARGELLCLLNNDIAAITPGWLTEMVGLALQPGVGAVGAKLLYPNGTIQHAGTVAGLIGVAAHPYVREPGTADGYLLQLQTTREVSAVTAACMVIRRDRFLEVAGFDEAELGVAFNDVDLCFKLLRAGYRNIWTPHAQLQHVESASRGTDERSADRQRFLQEEAVMRRRWPEIIGNDPYYSPHLSLDSNIPRPAWPPRVSWSWTGQR
jgi:O-antigen biosynthesis protein